MPLKVIQGHRCWYQSKDRTSTFMLYYSSLFTSSARQNIQNIQKCRETANDSNLHPISYHIPHYCCGIYVGTVILFRVSVFGQEERAQGTEWLTTATFLTPCIECRAVARKVYCTSVRPSVRPSNAWIVTIYKRKRFLSRFL